MARTQAPKRPPEDKRQWVHGAPNSKLSKGVGRCFNKGDNGKFVPKTIDQAKEVSAGPRAKPHAACHRASHNLIASHICPALCTVGDAAA